jgi:hypothetical protein
LLNELPSHAGEKGVFDIKASLLTFLPLSAISHDAQALQEKYLAPIQARVDDGDCPPGLRKQYELQLGHIKAQAPSHEIALLPSIDFSLGERDDLGNSRSPVDPPPTVPNPKRKHATFVSFFNRPFSRGSIVRIEDLPLFIVNRRSTMVYSTSSLVILLITL